LQLNHNHTPRGQEVAKQQRVMNWAATNGTFLHKKMLMIIQTQMKNTKVCIQKIILPRIIRQTSQTIKKLMQATLIKLLLLRETLSKLVQIILHKLNNKGSTWLTKQTSKQTQSQPVYTRANSLQIPMTLVRLIFILHRLRLKIWLANIRKISQLLLWMICMITVHLNKTVYQMRKVTRQQKLCLKM